MCVLSKEQLQSENEPQDTISSDDNQDSVLSILKLMRNYAQKLRFGDEEDFVLVLGNTGAGKSVLTSLLTDVELNSNETLPDSGEFVIADECGLISDANSATTSKTIIPELMTDHVNRVTYYDCPGFNDSRGVANDISVTYLIQQLIKYANRLKLVFAVNYASVNGTADRHDFLNSVKHATTFVKNINAYRDGIVLVITKVENRYVMKNGQVHLVEDAKVIETIGAFLENTKMDLEKKNADNIPIDVKQSNSKQIQFIDILLQKNKINEYDRIGILRLADQSGLVKDIPKLQSEKNDIRSMINRKIQYIYKKNSDFGYTISHESQNRLRHIIEQLQTRLTDDVKNIGNEITEFYLQQEKYISDINVLKAEMSMGHKKLCEIQSRDSKTYVQLVVDAAEHLGIGVSFDNSHRIWQHIECVEFIENISCFSNSFNISLGLASSIQYLDESQKWYRFLIDMHDEISKYHVLKNCTKHSNALAHRLINQLIFDANKEKSVKDVGLPQFLDAIDCKIYASIETIQINSFKAKALETILNQILDQNICSIVESDVAIDTYIVKGYNVKMTDVMEQCPNQIKHIKVFALNNLFIDTDVDKTGERVQLTLIAPTWHVIDKRKIILSGENGEPHSELQAKESGEHGINGSPGGPGGHFMAVGNKFNGAENLEIIVNGGAGGPGQHGANGKDGVKGTDPPEESFHFFGASFSNISTQFSSVGVSRIPPFLTIDYEIKGTNSKKPSAGGNGGCGGIGGDSGEIIIVPLKENAKQFSLVCRKGADGEAGRGGNGGRSEKNGKTRRTKNLFLIIGVLNIDEEEEDGTVDLCDAARGLDGQPDPSPPAQPDPFVNQYHTVNQYKEYVREHIANHPRETQMMEFLDDLSKNKQIQSLYNPSSFVDELFSMEKQYFPLRNKVSFTPFVKSLRQRIVEYADSASHASNLSKEDQQVLNYVYTATLSKLCSIQNLTKNASTVDLLKYLELMHDHIKDLHEFEREDRINQHRRQFKGALDYQIKAATKLIQMQIMPEIEKMFIEISEHISRFAAEKSSREQELKKQMIKQRIIFWLKIFGLLGMFLCAAGVIIAKFTDIHEIIMPVLVKNGPAKIMNAVPLKNVSSVDGSTAPIVNVAKNKARSNENGSLVTLLHDFHRSFDDIVKLVKSQLRNFNQKLNKIEKMISDFFDHDFSKLLKGQIKEFKSKIAGELYKDGPYDPNIVDKMKTDLQETINLEKDALNAQNTQKSDQHFEAKMQKLEYAQEVLVDDGTNYETDDQNTNETLETNASNKEIRALDQFEQILGERLIAQVYEIKKSIDAMNKDWQSKSQIQLDLSEWRIQSLIKDAKVQFQKLTAGFDTGRDVERCIDKINEATGMLNSIYDRIDSYAEKAELATYIANIASASCSSHPTDNDELNEVICGLNKMIQTNLILEQYEIAVNAFKQHKFPFAHFYTSEFKLPSTLQFNDTDELKKQTIQNIQAMKNALQQSKTSILKYDQDVVLDKAATFYTWQYDDIKDAIDELLQGQQILLKADIANGMNQNAVKFKEIAIYLKLSNESAQTELDAKLQGFNVIMTMVGNNYYRCGNRSYSMSVDDNIVIEYSIKRNDKGKPVSCNGVYAKIQDGDFFLSPYTMWGIQLAGNFDELNCFRNKIVDLQLIGHGQYVKQSSSLIGEFSNNVLDKHYDFDGIISFAKDKKIINNF